MPPTDPTAVLRETGAVEIQQDIGAVTLTMHRLDPVWATRLLRPLLILIFAASTLLGLGLLVEALFTLSSAITTGLIQLFAALLVTGMAASTLAGLLSPVLGYRMLGYQIRLSQTAVELPGGLLVRRRTIPFDQITAVRAGEISALSWRGFWWGSGAYLELVTRDGAELVRIPLKKRYRDPLLALIQAHAAGQRQRLTSAGHDLAEPASPPQTLRALLER